jgi:thioredoxin 1
VQADRLTENREPAREEVERTSGPLLLEFGASWCGHCRAIAPQVARLLEKHPEVQHIKVEDGPGQPLGRSFRVKLWPTFVFLRDGRELAKAVRPGAGEVRKGLDAISAPTSPVDQTFNP